MKGNSLDDGETLAIYLDAQLHSEYSLEVPMLVPDHPFKIFNCTNGLNSGAASEICDIRFVCIDSEVLSMDRIRELHVPMGAWRCVCKQFNGPAHNHCKRCFGEKLKSGLFIKFDKKNCV